MIANEDNAMPTAQLRTTPHWYREPWPWLLMAGPAAVIVAGVFTTYLAVVSNDGIVADDYYKRGLAINQTLSRDALARQRHLRARVEFSADFGRVTVAVTDNAAVDTPLALPLAHLGRPALDRLLPLTREADGRYLAAFPVLTPGRWQVTLEDRVQSWRLVGDVVVPGNVVLDLAPR
jgi:hypothetical protein